MKFRILRCKHCGNIIIFQDDSGVTPSCCGETMEELLAGTEEQYADKHIPIIIKERETTKHPDLCQGSRSSKRGSCDSYVTIKVGSTQHPMEDAHYIEWITLQTNFGTYTKFMEPGDTPATTFCLGRGEEPERAYAYCNIHGLWMNK